MPDDIKLSTILLLVVVAFLIYCLMNSNDGFTNIENENSGFTNDELEPEQDSEPEPEPIYEPEMETNIKTNIKTNIESNQNQNQCNQYQLDQNQFEENQYQHQFNQKQSEQNQYQHQFEQNQFNQKQSEQNQYQHQFEQNQFEQNQSEQNQYQHQFDQNQYATVEPFTSTELLNQVLAETENKMAVPENKMTVPENKMTVPENKIAVSNSAPPNASVFNFQANDEIDNFGASLDIAFDKPIPDCVKTDIVDLNRNNVKNYNAKDFLPKEINDDWFNTDFSQAKYNINDDKLINTEKYVIGVNTVGQSLKNASYDIRGSINVPKFSVSPWNNSTTEPDYNIKPLY
jgi:hypothetical protein